jgi:tRNA (guanine37-N1)-methyltransferase
MSKRQQTASSISPSLSSASHHRRNIYSIMMRSMLLLLPSAHRYKVSCFRSSSLASSRLTNNHNRVRGKSLAPQQQFQQSTTRSLAFVTTDASSISSTSSNSLQENNPTDIDIDTLIDTWRDNPAINPTLEFQTWLVPSPSLQKLVKEPRLQPFLPYTAASASAPSCILQHIHPRIKIIQDHNASHKLLLRALEEDIVDDDVDGDGNHLPLLQQKEENDKEMQQQQLQQLLSLHQVVDGPTFSCPVTYKQLSLSYILSHLLPDAKTTPPPTAYEQIGHVAHFNLRPHHLPYGNLIGQVLVEINPSIKTVVTKLGQVSGPYRTYDLQVLAGTQTTETIHGEHGLSLHLDVATCYWCTRLSGERQVLLQEIKTNSLVADVFCGVGTMCLLAARDKQCRIVANDWNPSAIDYFSKNILANGLQSTQTQPSKFNIQCGDAYDFLTDLGLRAPTTCSQQQQDDGGGGGSSGVATTTITTTNGDSDEDEAPPLDYRLPDHIIMNYPLEAHKFLGAFRWWPSQKLRQHYRESGSLPRIHLYTFARADDSDNENGNVAVDHPQEEREEIAEQDLCYPSPMIKREEEDVAVDLIAEELLPSIGGVGGPSSSYFRRTELNDEYGCNVQTRVVRDVAPGKLVVCVSFTLTPKLLRHMQGDYFSD